MSIAQSPIWFSFNPTNIDVHATPFTACKKPINICQAVAG